MFRAKDRAQLDLLKAQLDAIQSHMAGCTTMGLSAQLNEAIQRACLIHSMTERIEQGQSVLKADLDALSERITKQHLAGIVGSTMGFDYDSEVPVTTHTVKRPKLKFDELKGKAKKRSKKP